MHLSFRLGLGSDEQNARALRWQIRVGIRVGNVLGVGIEAWNRWLLQLTGRLRRQFFVIGGGSIIIFLRRSRRWRVFLQIRPFGSHARFRSGC
ncbi:unnamed protein product [Linum trigynum]|uniref:Uncharacterized protein n=1 Tax=Linum trigynum TaxID=586398 RepID=A0AAV2EAL5_9ROSI